MRSLLAVVAVSALPAFGQPAYSLPIDVSWGSPLFVEARVNGSEPLRFIVDSASTWSMLRRAEAEKLRLPTTRSQTAAGGGGAFEMQFGRATITVGTLVMNDIELGVTNLPQHYAGILGADLFERFVVALNYESGRLELYEPDRFRPSPSAIRLDVNLRGRIPCIQASISFSGHDAPGEFRVDTASFAAITLNAPFASRHQFPPPGAPVREIRGGSLSGPVQFLQARAGALRLGSMLFERPIVQVYATDRGSGVGTVLAGHIGNQILRRFRVIFDCPHRALYFEPNSLRNDPFELDMSGLAFGPEFRIAAVEKDSPAEAAGIQPGDLLLRINGKPVSALGLARAHDLLMQDGATPTVELDRSGKTLSFTLALHRRF